MWPGTSEGMPETMDVTEIFVHAEGKTTVTVSHMGYGASAEHAAMGWEQAFEKLAAVLAGEGQ